MIAFIDDHRGAYGVEPICECCRSPHRPITPMPPDGADPSRLPARVKRDASLMPEIPRVFEENFQVYGVRKVWRQLRARGRGSGPLHGWAADANDGFARRYSWQDGQDHDQRQGGAVPAGPREPAVQAPRPNALWVSDFTYVATWAGFVYVAFVIDTFARRIVGWRVRRTAHAGFVLDALEQALHDRRPLSGSGLVHHSDRGMQYVSIKYTERLAEAGIEPSVGSVGDSYDNALAETINGLYKAEVIHRRGPWRSFEAVEFATLEWVDWFNHRRLLEPIGNIPPGRGRRPLLRYARRPAMAA